MLEDKMTGPLYKTVYMYKTKATFSVTKINEIISRFFAFIWLIIVTKYLLTHITFKGSIENIAWVEIILSLSTLYFIGAMFWGYGRGHFGAQEFDFKVRKVFK